MSATCPISECGFSGAVESVEAHISGSTTGAHQGVLGREYRGELEEAVPPWVVVGAIATVLLALHLAQRGGSGKGGEVEEDDQETVLVDPASLAHEGRGVVA